MMDGTPVQIEAAGLQAQPFAPFHQALDDSHHLIRAAHQGQSQCVAFVVFEDIQRAKTMKVGGTMFGPTASNVLICFVVLPMLGDFGHIDRRRTGSSPRSFRSAHQP